MVRVHTNHYLHAQFRLVSHQSIRLYNWLVAHQPALQRFYLFVLTSITADDKPADVAVSLIAPGLAVACKIARHKP